MEPNNLLNKLKGVERFVNTYSIGKEDLVKEIPINISVEILKSVVTPKEGDDLLYMGYILDEKQLHQLSVILGLTIVPRFKLYYYVLECVGTYDW
jgi:hypothetical protein